MLYTMGYNNFSFFEFRDKLKSLDAIVIDVRFSPNSYSSFWGKDYLKDLFGDSYIHIKELGNKNYSDKSLEFDIPGLENGSKKVIELLEMGFDCILMCSCSDYNKCHRKIVAEYICEKTNCELINL